MAIKRTVLIPQMWQLHREMRHFVEETCVEIPIDVRDATSMVVSELVSNAIKYGDMVPNQECASVTLTLKDDQIQVAVSSGAPSEESVRELRERIEQIASAESVEQLYMTRLQELLDNSSEKGGLGLYRIGFEGRFQLTYTHTDQVVVVTATRGLPCT